MVLSRIGGAGVGRRDRAPARRGRAVAAGAAGVVRRGAAGGRPVAGRGSPADAARGARVGGRGGRGPRPRLRVPGADPAAPDARGPGRDRGAAHVPHRPARRRADRRRAARAGGGSGGRRSWRRTARRRPPAAASTTASPWTGSAWRSTPRAAADRRADAVRRVRRRPGAHRAGAGRRLVPDLGRGPHRRGRPAAGARPARRHGGDRRGERAGAGGGRAAARAPRGDRRSRCSACPTPSGATGWWRSSSARSTSTRPATGWRRRTPARGRRARSCASTRCRCSPTASPTGCGCGRCVKVFSIPLHTRFRGITVREGVLLRGDDGVGGVEPVPRVRRAGRRAVAALRRGGRGRRLAARRCGTGSRSTSRSRRSARSRRTGSPPRAAAAPPR